MTYVDGINQTTVNYLCNAGNTSVTSLKNADDESIFASCDEETAEMDIAETDNDAKQEDKGFFAKITNNAIKNALELFGKKETFIEIANSIAKDDKCDKEIPEIVIKRYGSFADDIYYNKNGEIVIAIKKTPGVGRMSTNFGEVRGTFYDDKGDEYFAIVLDASKNDNTKNGEIENTKQGPTADCWLLSSINSLSYTQKGREIIKDSLEYQDDCTIVHLKDLKDYTITNDELQNAKLSGKYSSGDDDMILFELAVEKAFKDIENHNIKIGHYDIAKGQDYDSLDGGTQHLGFGIITNKRSDPYDSDETIEKLSSYCIDRDSKINKKLLEYYSEINASVAFDKFEADCNTNLALGVESYNSKEVTDINGDSITLSNFHSYSVKEIKGDEVVITDPHDSGKDIILSRETAANIFDTYTLCDLSDD